MLLVLLIVVVIGLLGLSAILVGFGRLESRRERALIETSNALTRSRSLAQADLVLLRADVAHLAVQGRELSEVDPTLGEQVLSRLAELHDHVDAISTALVEATTPQQVTQGTAELASVRREHDSIVALLSDDDPPTQVPPCFFNPNHGTSVTAVTWKGGAHSIRVPSCAADTQRLRQGAAPYSRTVAGLSLIHI